MKKRGKKKCVIKKSRNLQLPKPGTKAGAKKKNQPFEGGLPYTGKMRLK
jgi:hypothetical protein